MQKDARNTRWPPQIVGAGPMLGAAVRSGPVRVIGMGLVTAEACRAEQRRRRGGVCVYPNAICTHWEGWGGNQKRRWKAHAEGGTHRNAVGGPSGCGRGGQQRVALRARQRLAIGGPVAVEADTDLSHLAANPSLLSLRYHFVPSHVRNSEFRCQAVAAGQSSSGDLGFVNLPTAFFALYRKFSHNRDSRWRARRERLACVRACARFRAG